MLANKYAAPSGNDVLTTGWKRTDKRGWLAAAVLAGALMAVFVFVSDPGVLYRTGFHNWNTARNLAMAEHFSFAEGVVHLQETRRADDTLHLWLYNRFPIGNVALIKLATAPFAGDLSAQLIAARTLWLAFWCGAAVLLYLALVRLIGSRAIALSATLLAFSSQTMLHYNDMVGHETSADMFAVLLVFHAMVLFNDAPTRRFPQLLIKTCAALLLGWHVYALLLPFVAFGLGRDVLRRVRAAPTACGITRALVRGLGGRHVVLGCVALAFGAAVLGYNFAAEYRTLGVPYAELPSVRSFAQRTGWDGAPSARMEDALAWRTFVPWQLHRVGGMVVPFGWTGHAGVPTERILRAHAGPFLAWLGVLVLLVCFGALLFGRKSGRWSRARGLLMVLALSGICWAVGMRHNTADVNHEHEAQFFVGLAAVFFAFGCRLLLSAARRLGADWHGRIALCLVAGAASTFVHSTWRFTEAARNPHAAVVAGQMAEFEAIREHARGKEVLVAATETALYGLMRASGAVGGGTREIGSRAAFHYYMATSVVRFMPRTGDRPPPSSARPPDFVLAFERVDSPCLLKPDNRFVFLYNCADVLVAIEAARQREYDAIAESAPAARALWNVYVRVDAPGKRTLAYVKAPCGPEDTATPFFVQVLPAAPSPLPAFEHRRDGFVNVPSGLFDKYGRMLDDACLMRVPLPDFEIAQVKTGQYVDGETSTDRVEPRAWEVAFAPRFDDKRHGE